MIEEELEVLDFGSATPKKIKVVVDGVNYVLIEGSGDVATKYRNAVMSRVRVGMEGRPSQAVGMADVESFLISMCLFTADNDLNPLSPVPEKKIRSWPNRVQAELFTKSKQISYIREAKDNTPDTFNRALRREDSPIKLQELRDWANSEALADKEWDSLRLFLSPTPEELSGK